MIEIFSRMLFIEFRTPLDENETSTMDRYVYSAPMGSAVFLFLETFCCSE